MNILDALADDFLLVSWQLSHKVDRPDHDQQLSELPPSAPLSSVGGTCNHMSVAVLNKAQVQTVLVHSFNLRLLQDSHGQSWGKGDLLLCWPDASHVHVT